MSLDRNNPYAQQERFEFDTWMALLATFKPRRYLEIGSCYGHTIEMTLKACPTIESFVSVDLGEIMVGDKPEDSGVVLAERCLRLHATRGYDYTLVRGNSHHVESREQVEKLGPFDVVFIDGDHTYAGVGLDWNYYGKLAPIVAFHDINCQVTDVPLFWTNHIRPHYRNVEIIHPKATVPHHFGFGIGVAFK